MVLFCFSFLLGCFFGDIPQILALQADQSQENEDDFWPEEENTESVLNLNWPQNDENNSAQNQTSSTEANPMSPGAFLKRGSALFSFERKGESESVNLSEELLFDAEINRIEELIPAQSLMFVKTVSIQKLDEIGKYMLFQIGFVGFSPLSLLKWTTYGKSIQYLDLKRSLAVVYCLNQSRPVRLLILPVKNGSAFIQSLGVKAKSATDGVVWEIKGKNPSVVYLKNGYAVLVSEPNKEMALQYYNEKSIAQTKKRTSIPQGLVHSQISLTVMPRGIQYFSALGHSALNDFEPFFHSLLNSLEQSDSSQMTEFGLNLENGFKTKNEIDYDLGLAFQKGEESIQWIRQNIQAFRLDCVVRQNSSVLALTFIPNSQSELERQINDSFVPITPTTLGENRFLKVLPETFAPVSGQIDITQNIAEKLEAPFNRLRHVEYSLSLPQKGELLAESWAFFLEVDDSEQFIKELIVPKAKLIGGHIGSETAGEIGAQLLGNLAVRRQNRQLGRNRFPGRLADPQAAAERGERIGSLLGGLIGQSAGENEAMKQYEFEGYPLYISDLELYDREMRRIRAKEQGQIPPKPIFLTGEPTLMILLGNLLNGMENGNLENLTRSALTQFSPEMNGNQTDQPLLLARNNYILVLDEHHLLIVPGNESLLRTAKNNWNLVRHFWAPKETVNRSQAILPPSLNSNIVGWESLWDDICWEMPNAFNHHLRSSTQINILGAQLLCDSIRQNYASNFPGPFAELLSNKTPSTLTISTTSGNFSYLYFAASHLTVKNVIKTFFLNKKAK